MKFILHTIKLLEVTESFNGCVVLPFPEGGKIVSHFTVQNAAFIVVQAAINAQPSSAHFHAVSPNTPIYADEMEFVATFEFAANDVGQKPILLVVRITNGGFGIHSQDYIDEYGEPTEGQLAIEEPKVDFEPLSTEEIYQLFKIDSPQKKEAKRKYKKRIKDNPEQQGG